MLRNLLITQCYSELSSAFCAFTGTAANWCSFATWASRQAGMTIRGEDLQHAIDGALKRVTGIGFEDLYLASLVTGINLDGSMLARAVSDVLDPAAIARRSADAVARGNLKVFAEIGRVFAQFVASFESMEMPDQDRLAVFCAALRPGDPPDGQGFLVQAFTLYADARFEPDPALRAQRIYAANLLVGLHEQTRLQPEIVEAMDAAIPDRDQLRKQLLNRLLPGIWIRIRLFLARLLGRDLPFDRALDAFGSVLRGEVRKVLTDRFLTLHLSRDHVLRLGRDLQASFPPVLAEVASPLLLDILARVDPTPDSTLESGADDWADLPDRMHFITDFFRCFHAWEPLFDPPFTAAQVARLKAGIRPDGPL